LHRRPGEIAIQRGGFFVANSGCDINGDSGAPKPARDQRHDKARAAI
jgi:hypothetical protein